MGLHEQIKEIEAEEEKRAKKEDSPESGKTEGDSDVEKDTPPAVEKKEPEKEPPAKDPKKEEKEPPAKDPKKEEKEPEKKPEPEEKPDSSAYARMRMETAAAKRRADSLEAQLRAKNEPAPVKTDEKAPPDRETDPEAYLQWRIDDVEKKQKEIETWQKGKQQEEDFRRRKDAANESLGHLAKEVIDKYSDGADVLAYGEQAIKNSLRIREPFLTGKKFDEKFELEVLRWAGEAEARGYQNPAEYLYQLSKSWGYQPKAPEKAAEPEKAKPDLKAIVDHKKKSVSSMAGGKGGNAPRSKEFYANLPFHEVARLSPEELREWEKLS